MIIREATELDIEQMAILLRELFLIEQDFNFNKSKQRNGLDMMRRDGSCCIMVAELNNEIVGMCSIQILISSEEGGKAGLVEDMVVRKDCRGQKIGTRLLSAIQNWARENGITRLQLLTDKNNWQAIDFYSKTGWEKTQLICFRKYTENR
ncbi:MAG: GNAT family N-acetyltransferase [Planctomycetes bacterium]|nr:GNAT family N-acetyltransferase [Planctomycetota bacterium]